MKPILLFVLVLCAGCAKDMSVEQRRALYLAGVGMQSFGAGMQRGPTPLEAFNSFGPLHEVKAYEAFSPGSVLNPVHVESSGVRNYTIAVP
jgi:hypothetical protein